MSIQNYQGNIIDFLQQDIENIDKQINEKVDVFSQWIFRSIAESLEVLKTNELFEEAIHVLSDHHLDYLYANDNLSEVVNLILSDKVLVNHPTFINRVQCQLENKNLYEKLVCCKTREDYSKLHKYCYHGKLDKLKEIVKKSIPSQNSKACDSLDLTTLLHISSRSGQVDVVKYLIESGADVNKTTEGVPPPLHVTCTLGHKEVVKVLLKHDAKVNKAADNNITPLFNACWKGHKEVVELLLKYGADANIMGGFSRVTPLMVAAYYGHSEIVKLLLGKGADVNIIEGNSRVTALYCACRNGDKKIVDLLIKTEPDYVALNNGMTPLRIACMNGHVEIADLLLNNGYGNDEINEIDDKGESLFTITQNLSKQYPSANQFIQMVAVLMRHGAVDFKAIIEQKKMQSVCWEPISEFGEVIDELRKTFNSRDEYILSPEAKGKVEVDGQIPIEGEYMHIARDPVQSEFQYIFEMILAFEQLDYHIDTIEMWNNGTDFSTNPGAQFAHAVSGMVVHIKAINNLKDFFSIGPKLLLAAYKDATKNGKLKYFFENAFDKSIICLNARVTKLNEYLEEAQNLIDPYAEDFEVHKKENLEEQLYEYSRVFRNLQIEEIAQELKTDYKEVKEKIDNEPESREYQLFQKLFTKKKFEQYLTKNFPIKIDLSSEQYDLFTSQFFDAIEIDEEDEVSSSPPSSKRKREEEGTNTPLSPTRKKAKLEGDDTK